MTNTDSVPWAIHLLGLATGALMIILVIAAYLLPTIVGLIRRKRNIWLIAFFNVFLGWTVIAWAIMLFEAFQREKD